MLDENVLMQKATNELISLFGKEYLKNNYKNTCRAFGMVDNQTFQLFVGIKDSDDLPNRKATEKGWVVYGKVLLDANTGKIKNIEYVLE